MNNIRTELGIGVLAGIQGDHDSHITALCVACLVKWELCEPLIVIPSSYDSNSLMCKSGFDEVYHLTEALVLVCDQEGGLTFGDSPSLVGVPLISIMYSMPVGGQVYSFVHDFDENEMLSIHRTPAGYKLRNANRTSIFERYTFKGEEILQFIENK